MGGEGLAESSSVLGLTGGETNCKGRLGGVCVVGEASRYSGL